MASKDNQKGKKKSTKEKDQKENRVAGERIPIQLLVDYKDGGNYLFDFCKDLGEGGVFIETKEPKPMGSTLELTFTIPDSKETLSTKGTVMWVQEFIEGRDDLTPGMGIQFVSFTPEHRKTLEAFVKRYSHNVSQSA